MSKIAGRNEKFQNSKHRKLFSFPTSQGEFPVKTWSQTTPLKRTANYRFLRTHRGRGNLAGQRQYRTSQEGPCKDREVPGFKALKLQAKIKKIQIPKTFFSRPDPRDGFFSRLGHGGILNVQKSSCIYLPRG